MNILAAQRDVCKLRHKEAAAETGPFSQGSSDRQQPSAPQATGMLYSVGHPTLSICVSLQDAEAQADCLFSADKESWVQR